MKCRSINFTKEALENLLPKADEVFEVSDTKVRGLRLRINSGGSKTFNLFKKINGRQRRFKLGRFPEITVLQARTKAIEAIAAYNMGQNPSEERSKYRKEFTFNELWETYYREHALINTKRPQDNKNMLEKHVLPQIGKIKISDITRDMIKRVHTNVWSKKYDQSKQKINYSHADRIITIVSSVFNFAINERYFTGSNPCIGIKKHTNISRDRFLSNDELKKFFAAVEAEDHLFRDLFLLLLYTGARKSNVLSMKWTNIDFDLNRWRIPETQTKNKDVNIVVLSSPALEILSKRKVENDNLEKPSQYVFPGNGEEGYLKDPKKAFQRIRDRMEVQDIRMHDLRRTLGSYMAISGISLPIIGKVLNHKSQVSTAIYARLSQNPLEDAVNIAARLMDN